MSDSAHQLFRVIGFGIVIGSYASILAITSSFAFIIIINNNNYGLLDTKVTIFLNATENIGDIKHGVVPYNNP